jgi:flagellar biosynthetic protein FliR
MPPAAHLEIPIAWLLNYVLLLARVSGFVVLVPIPGLRQAPATARIVLAATLAFVLAPLASGPADPGLLNSPAIAWRLAGLVVSEGVLGLAVGLAVSILIDAFGTAAQMLGFQAGYSYVNLVDPNTQVDASILNVMLVLLSSLLFFAFDLHLHVIRALTLSLREWPLGHFVTKPGDALLMVELGASALETAVRVALPIVAVLLLVDLTLGLLNQVNSRMQLLTLSFPAKIIAAIALLYPALLLMPRSFHDLASETFEVITAVVKR